jgi:hypothetical protein
MFENDIPGFGPVQLEHLVSDFTVSEGEGCAVDAIMAADIHVRSAADFLQTAILLLISVTFFLASPNLRSFSLKTAL